MMHKSADIGPARIQRHSKPIRFAVTVVIATVLGPLIGSVPFLLIIAIQLALSGQGAAEFVEAFGPVVMFSYFLGAVIAFVAGTIVALAALWRQPTLVTIVAATFIANAACYLAIKDALLQSFSISLAISTFAATICWLLFRRVLSN